MAHGYYPIVNLQFAPYRLDENSDYQGHSSESSENMDTETDETAFGNLDVDDGNDCECSYGLRMVRNPTFFPVAGSSSKISEDFSKVCQNCDCSDDEDNQNGDCPVDELTINSYAVQHNHSNVVKRKNSDNNPAVIYCKDCCLSMCRKCCECHGIMRRNRKHDVVPLFDPDDTATTFIKKSVHNGRKRRFITRLGTGKHSKAKTNRRERPPQHELSAEELLEIKALQAEAEKMVFDLNRRIDHLQSKLVNCDQVVEKFCQKMLGTQVSIVEAGDRIRKKVEAQMDSMLDRLKKESLKFCSHVEDTKEELVNSVMTLVKSRKLLMDFQEKSLLTKDERRCLIETLNKTTIKQNEVMSKRVDIKSKLDVIFRPTESVSACPSVGSLHIANVDLDPSSIGCLSSNLVKALSFDNEVRGLTALRKYLAVVTANSSTVYFLSLDTLEHVSSFNVKDLKNPYDLVSDKSDALYITEWSGKSIFRVEMPSKQVTKIPTKESYSTLSLTPCGSILATCQCKNKAAELKNKKLEGKVVQFSKVIPKNSPSRGSQHNQINVDFDDVASQNGTLSGNACHSLAFTSQCFSDEQSYNYLYCTNDNQLFLADDKGMPIRTYKRNQRVFAIDGSCLDGTAPSPVLQKPSHLAVDKEGLIYVCDSGNDRVIVLDGYLNFIKEILPPGMGGVKNPLRIYVDTNRSRLFVAATSLYIFDLF